MARSEIQIKQPIGKRLINIYTTIVKTLPSVGNRAQHI